MSEEWTSPNAEYPGPKPGEPPLHRAARIGDHDGLRRLVAGGADVNAQFDIGLDSGAREFMATPLMVAAGSGDGATVETIRLLLELGADASTVAGGDSAATIACGGLGWNYRPGGDVERLRLLLESGSPLPPSPRRRNVMLCDTARAGDAERLRVLLDRSFDARGHFDPEEARREHTRMQESMARYRADHPDPFVSLSEELRASMAKSSAELEEQQLQNAVSAPWGSDIPLHCAAESGNVECVCLLLDGGADPLARDSQKRTAMYVAGSAAVVRKLVESGVPLQDSDDYGWSPMVDAVGGQEGALVRVRALVEAGADVNASHDRGYTVFMSAVGSGRQLPILKYLVEHGADVHAVTDLGFNAFHAGVDVNGAANAEDSVRETFGYLKSLGVDIEGRTSTGLTPLARALMEGCAVEVEVLCEFGADPNAVCPKHECRADECTRKDLPLLFHAADGIGVDRARKTNALLRSGADPLAKDPEGHRVLSHVVSWLCSGAENYDGLFESFYKGLGELRFPGVLPEGREAFVAAVRPCIASYVMEFAAKIPHGGMEIEKILRTERLECAVSLGTYEAWARHEFLRRKSERFG